MRPTVAFHERRQSLWLDNRALKEQAGHAP
jgi:hypothetical protein